MTETSRAKPRHLAAEYAAQFDDEDVAAAYRYRPPYPPDTFVVLASLVGSRPRTVLELGAGTGDLTVGLAPLVDDLIAVEPSGPMLERGLRRTRAMAPRVTWLPIAAEDYAFGARYSAVLAAEAFHWLDWDRVLPRIAASLAPGGHLILIERTLAEPLPWDEDLRALVRRFSTNQDYVAYDTVTELETRRLFTVAGRARTHPVIHRQRVAEYVESFHSRNGFSRARLGPVRARQFDDNLTALLDRECGDGFVRLPVQARIVWGRPEVLLAAM